MSDAKVLIIDGDWVVFMMAFAANSQMKKDGKLMPIPLVLKLVDNYIDKLMRRLDATSYVFILTGRNNFRKNIVYDHVPTTHKSYGQKAYKANRKGTELPPYLNEIRLHLEDRHGALTEEFAEADDGLGIWVYANQDTSILVACDKDLDMIPGKHYNPRKDEEYEVTEEGSLIFAATQILTGDSVDNIPSLYSAFGKKVTKKVRQEVVDQLHPARSKWLSAEIRAFEMACKTVETMYPDLNDLDVNKFCVRNRDLIWIHRDKAAMDSFIGRINGS